MNFLLFVTECMAKWSLHPHYLAQNIISKEANCKQEKEWLIKYVWKLAWKNIKIMQNCCKISNNNFPNQRSFFLFSKLKTNIRSVIEVSSVNHWNKQFPGISTNKRNKTNLSHLRSISFEQSINAVCGSRKQDTTKRCGCAWERTHVFDAKTALTVHENSIDRW